MNAARNPVGWFEIYVQDMTRARAFYEGLLQTKLSPLDAPNVAELWAFSGEPDRPGAAGALVKMVGKDSGSGGTIVYFSCRDCAEEAARAAELGGQLVEEKFSIGEYGFIAFVQDPDGNVIGLHSMS